MRSSRSNRCSRYHALLRKHKRRLSDLLHRGIIDYLIGVIDLRKGQAVHAVAGNRDLYAAVSTVSSAIAGDATSLARRYRELGLTGLYIADLDAIETQSPQTELIRQILACDLGFCDIVIDLGWTGDEHSATQSAILELAADYPALWIVAATESAKSLHSIARLAESVSAQRIILGMDYRGGRLISDFGDESAWFDEAQRLKVGGILVLDLQAVGTSAGAATAEICHRIRPQFPHTAVLSGGGIRSARDVRQLIRAGCDKCLVATALHERLHGQEIAPPAIA